MARTKQELPFEPGTKLQRRWEAVYPEFRCCRLLDPERGGSYEAIRLREQKGYEIIDLTDSEKKELLDSTHYILMGCPIKRWEENMARQRAIANPEQHIKSAQSVVDGL